MIPDCEMSSGGEPWTLNECPLKMIDSKTLLAIRLARFAKEGAWPIAGGTLDQSRWFFDAAELVWRELDAK